MNRIGAQIGGANGIFIPMEVVRAVVVSTARNVFGERLRAVILTGSLARNEGTFVPTSSGFALLGDCDLLVMFREEATLASSSEMQKFENEAAAALLEAGIVATISSSAIHANYLMSLLPSIFAYELRANGSVIWGDADCLQLIPSFEAKDIPLEDAWRMLCNRMIECLEHISPDQTVQAFTPGASQALAKLYLDMATSLLTFLGLYRPSYRERLEQLMQLDSDQRARLPFSFQEFVDAVRKSTKWKLTSVELTPANTSTVQAAAAFAHALFRWELQELTSEKRPLSDHQLVKAWEGRRSLRTRIRGWAAATRTSLVGGNKIAWGRWLRLAIATSPRTAVYRAGAELFFELEPSSATSVEKDWSYIRSYLLFSDSTSGRWSDVSKDIVSNYKFFLTGTTA
jgi:hypothetical protein